jgi:LAO/AO transport system kinase
MLRLGPELVWTPPVVRTAAATGDGVRELWTAMERHRADLRSSGRLAEGRRRRLLREVESLTAEELRGRIGRLLDEDPAMVAELTERRTDPYRAATLLAERATRSSSREAR